MLNNFFFSTKLSQNTFCFATKFRYFSSQFLKWESKLINSFGMQAYLFPNDRGMTKVILTRRKKKNKEKMSQTPKEWKINGFTNHNDSNAWWMTLTRERTGFHLGLSSHHSHPWTQSSTYPTSLYIAFHLFECLWHPESQIFHPTTMNLSSLALWTCYPSLLST